MKKYIKEIEWKTLGEICEIERGIRVKKKDLSLTGNYPVVSGGTGYMGYLDEYNRGAETITIAQYGTAGYVNWQKKKFWANDICFSVFPKNMVLNKYLYYFLKNKQEYLYKISNKTAIPYSISKEKILKILIPLPPLKKQEEIAAVLNKFTELTEELTAELTAREAQYEYYRNMLLSQEWIEREEGKEVEWKKLKEISQVTGAGVDKKKKENEQEVKLLNYMDVYKRKYIDSNTLSMVVTSQKDKIQKCNIEYGDIFITPSSETLEDILKSSISIEDIKNAVYSYHIMRIRLNKRNFTTSCYLNYLFDSQEFRDKMFKKVNGNIRKTIAKTEVENLTIPFPSLKTQQKIVDILDKFDTLTNDIRQDLPREIELRQKQYKYYREKLLTFEEK